MPDHTRLAAGRATCRSGLRGRPALIAALFASELAILGCSQPHVLLGSDRGTAGGPADAAAAPAGDGSASSSAGSGIGAGSSGASGTAAMNAGAAASMDAGPAGAGGAAGDAALPAPDARASDAGPVACMVDAGTDGSCAGHLCSVDGVTFLALRGDEPWTAGGLNWVASICERPIGWPAAATTDSRDILYALALSDVSEIEAGAPVLVYWGNPDSAPIRAQACAVEAAAQLPACPETTTPPTHPSMLGCRGPLDPGCAVCRDASGSFHHASPEGTDWFNAASPEPPAGTCGSECPLCGTCSYRDEQTTRELPARSECQPCPADDGLDPCFGAGSCECWCATYKTLRAACPTLLR